MNRRVNCELFVYLYRSQHCVHAHNKATSITVSDPYWPHKRLIGNEVAMYSSHIAADAVISRIGTRHPIQVRMRLTGAHTRMRQHTARKCAWVVTSLSVWVTQQSECRGRDSGWVRVGWLDRLISLWCVWGLAVTVAGRTGSRWCMRQLPEWMRPEYVSSTPSEVTPMQLSDAITYAAEATLTELRSQGRLSRS